MDFDDCIESCQDCRRICLETLMHCLEEGGRHTEVEPVRSLIDCAAGCAFAIDLMLRGSEMALVALRACAEICERTALDCDRMDLAEDPRMTDCGEMCSACAETCRELLQAAA